MSSYSKTYTGLVLIILGWFGFSHLVTSDQVASIIDNLAQLVGIGIAIYGRYKVGDVSILGFKK